MKKSAGILLYKLKQQELFVLLVHPGGPFYAKKDLGAWTIPKGEFEEEEEALQAAQREFFEETGQKISGDPMPLKPIKQKGGKIVYVWAVEGEFDFSKLISNTFEMEWPPRSGKKQSFPEIDKAEWFTVEEANNKIIQAQQDLIKELLEIIQEK